jgi:hypothetical protein
VILDRGEPSDGPWLAMSLVESAAVVLDAIGQIVAVMRIASDRLHGRLRG